MPFPFIHHSDNFQDQLESRGYALDVRWYGLQTWRQMIQGGPDDWPTSKDELKAARIDSKELIALKEMDQMTEVEKQVFDAAIATGMKDLAARFRPNLAVPEVPSDIYDNLQTSIPEELQDDPYGWEDLDLDIWLRCYPNLDKYTAKALLSHSDDDLFGPTYMLATGAHFVSQEWTDGELKNWYEGLDGVQGAISIGSSRPTWPPKTKSGKLAPTKRAKLIAQLTWDVMNYSMECVGIADLEHTAGRVKNLSLEDLLVESEQAGVKVSDRNNKAALVVALVEHIYADVIEPMATA